MCVEQTSPSWAKKERKHLLQASLALWDTHSVFLYAPTLILWTRSFRLKNLSLCSQSGCFAKSSFLSGCSEEWLFWSLIYWDCASPLKGSRSITPLCHFLVTKEMPPTIKEAVQLMRMFPAKSLGRRVKRHTGMAQKATCKVRNDHFRSMHLHLPSCLPLDHSNTL